MNYAIDLHSNNFLAGWRGKDGNVFKKRYDLKNDGLSKFKKILTKDDFVAVESTRNSYYFYDEIRPLVKRIMIVNPTRFKVICESSSKCDKKDVSAILTFMELDMIPEINIPPKPVRILRGLFSTYLILVRQKTEFKNRAHALLNANGIFIRQSDIFCIKGKQEIEEIKTGLCPDDQFQLSMLLDAIEQLEKRLAELKEKIMAYSFFFKKEIEILMSIPGISLFIGLAIMTDLVNIKNFKNAKKLCSYLGIAPKTKESNKKITYGRINKKGRKLARSFLSQVIFHFIGSSEYYEELYQQKKKSRGTGKAIVTMMRRLMVIIYHMLKKEQPFNKINRRLHLAKMNDWLKFIKKVKSMKEEDFQKWEHDIHLKYDVEYKEKIRKKLIMNKKSA